jgi:hypothetical protein
MRPCALPPLLITPEWTGGDLSKKWRRRRLCKIGAKPLAHPVERLQIELLGGLCRDELHGRALHCLGDRLSIAEVVLLASRVGPHIFGWHQPSVVTKRCEFAA